MRVVLVCADAYMNMQSASPCLTRNVKCMSLLLSARATHRCDFELSAVSKRERIASDFNAYTSLAPNLPSLLMQVGNACLTLIRRALTWPTQVTLTCTENLHQVHACQAH